jgi:2-amino-4-hydroxy-6-hydroxymethyldihydropteridine diphosphokinase
MPTVYVGAGSNVAPERHLACAVAELTRRFPGARFSHRYRNRAAEGGGSDFVNMAASFDTQLAPAQLRVALRAIEGRCGRVRDGTNAVALDVDLLLYGDLVHADAALTLPRPELLTRAYLLGPVAELAPELTYPGTSQTLAELWGAFDRAAHPLVRLDD